MTDNSVVVSGSGDTIRDIDRSLNPVAIAAKTQIVQLDAGGQSGESLVSQANPLPVADPYSLLVAKLQYQTILVAQAGPAGFVPLEIPSFLFG